MEAPSSDIAHPELWSEWNHFRTKEGKPGVLHLRRAVYGTVQAARCFNALITERLRGLGFMPTIQDEMVLSLIHI